ncbi:site-specific DNA-methyltransferase [Cellulomonas sp. zg-ZUI222]|uniref:site-specific DNA-methyltransferase n=1 Tax=Cellulomonas wangleii TaxID=2816956 RepID=UPI001A93F978|nr:site-specific DNA-methyltransferase [Cellulomonas wangleii]MBO0919788.1 site-specific DNA-methyltransferase [Cellulomonas wangleii]
MTEPFEPIDTLAGPGEAKTNAQTLARLVSEAFPEAVTEDGIDFEALKQLVGEEALPSTAEKFGLSWPGKAASRRLALLPPTGTLLPRPDESVEWDSTKNIVIEGDNLEVLRLLRRGYAGKVDVIYIDPPYNTGSDLVYHDSRVTPKDEFEAQVGERDGEGRLVKNTDASGRRHSAWLDMMHPRLWAARDLLKQTGVIIAAIDDNEHTNLRLLLDQVFGSENFLANVVWQGSGKNDARFTSGGLDYMLIYAANKNLLVANDVRFKEPKRGYDLVVAAVQRSWEQSGHDSEAATQLLRQWWRTRPDTERGLTSYADIDESGRAFTKSDLASPNPRANLMYELPHPVTGIPVPMHPNGWRLSKDSMESAIAEGRIQFGKDHTTTPRYKRFLDEMGQQAIRPVVTQERAPASDALAALLGEKVFDYPKDTQVVGTWLNAVTQSDRDAIVLDFFAGSGSTGHAVMDLNAADGGNRQYILVQIDEAVEHAKYKTIADIARERLRRAGKAIAAAQGLNAETLDLGFRSYRLAESNNRKWDGTLGEQSLEDAVATAVDNLLPGRTTDDLLVEMMLRLGLELTTRVEQKDVAGSPLYNIGSGTMFAHFGINITVDESKQIAQAIRTWRDAEGPVTEAAVVVRDTGFADSAAKLNLAAALNQAGITNLRSI